MAEYEDPIPSTSRKKRKSNDEENNTSERDSEEEDSSQPIEKKLKIKNKKKIEENGDTKKERKWSFLEHKGPVLAPPYEPLPDNVKFYYDGKEMKLSPEAEEVASFYSKMLDHDYTTKEVFNTNFFKDWRKVMNISEKGKIKDLKKCNFKAMHNHIAGKNRNRTKEEKQALKEKNEALVKEYGFCNIDGHKEKIDNCKIEPPGLFRGRGKHPKMGMLKRRVEAEDIIINCSKDSKIPVPPPGHQWKEVRHDDNVTWLASWTGNVQNKKKYIKLSSNSKLKGEKDRQKYETARRLHKCIDKIRNEYKEDWKSKEMRIRQRAVALYFIDKLALRAGNEKDEDQADTVGCCSLRVEHISLHKEKDGKEYVVVFDFLGKDSIRYYNEVPVKKKVYENLELFREGKKPEDSLFDRLNTATMNKHLNDLMEGLTAKVFRTYNASLTFQRKLTEFTNEDDTEIEKIQSYNNANESAALLCNHQRSTKRLDKSMRTCEENIEAKERAIIEIKKQIKVAEKKFRSHRQGKKKLQRLEDQLEILKKRKSEIQTRITDEHKTLALETSKLYYLDPRITVAWCKKYNVLLNVHKKIFNKSQREKFKWAIDNDDENFVF